MSGVEQKLYICYYLTSYLPHQQVSSHCINSGMMSQREHLKISIKLSLMIPSQKVVPISEMTDVSSCTVYQYSIVPRVDVSTVTSSPYTLLKVSEQFLHSLSHPGIGTQQKLINIHKCLQFRWSQVGTFLPTQVRRHTVFYVVSPISTFC